MRRALGVLAIAGLLVAATPTAFGGWAVVTLQEVPEYLEIGKPTTISFKIRQHGRTLLDDRSPTVGMVDPDASFLSRLFKRRSVRATRGSEPGLYEATITPSDTGAVRLIIDTDVFNWKAKLLPIRVVGAAESLPHMAASERGKHLFAAKGCATCHAKHDEPAFADQNLVQVGPDLTGRTYPNEWLATKIGDPGQARAIAGDISMPTLELDASEIEALVQFINGSRATATGDQSR
jgi:mono/diheme cytochrome c family protein